MRCSTSTALIASLLALPASICAVAVAEPAEEIVERATTCPSIWKAIAADLRFTFLGCGQPASSAIRFAFHDAAGYSVLNPVYGPASGGADGSLLLNDTEIARATENPLQGFRNQLLQKYNKYKSNGVSAADFVQFAGSIAVRSCPGGPLYTTVVGRQDDSTAAPDGNLPLPFGPQSSYDVLVQLWKNKGINERELAALMGAHTVSRSFAQQANGVAPGSPQDSSPQAWDNNYYSQIQAQNAPRGVSRFNSDIQLANPNTLTGQAFTEFAGNKSSWDAAFAPAMFKLSTLGIPAAKVATFTDCTSVVQNIFG